MTKALIVVDVQNDFISGSLPVPDGEKIAQRIALQLLPHTDADLRISTQDWHIDPRHHFEDWPVHCKAYTEGAELHDAIKDFDFDLQVRKGHYSAAYSGFEGIGINGWVLASFLRDKGVTDVIIVGLALDHCVKATALDAIHEGFQVTVLGAYTAPVTPEGGEQTIAKLEAAGVMVVRAATL